MSRTHPPTGVVGGTGTGASVDVLMLAYNVEPFIMQAVDGVLSQKADFPVRLLIAEDRSTDGTRAVCERLAQEHPSRITCIPGSENLGIAGRTVEGLTHCTARYVAICDSDDRWTDPGKLAEQVAFLEAHPDHGLSYTDVSIIDRDGAPVEADGYDGVRADYASGNVFVKLLQGNFINNSTTVVRRDLLTMLQPNACRDELIGDHVRWMQIAMRSKVHFLPRKTMAYRRGGVTGSQDIHARNRSKMLSLLGGLLLEHDRLKSPCTTRERAVLLRKVLGVLFRRGTSPAVKASLLVLVFKYIPASIGEWRAVFRKSGTRPAA
jgi:glycosyltransferase involved in cell wall biosynthesis